MKLKLISCEVFTRLACLAVADTPHTIDLEFTKLGAHESPETLRATIQEKIDAAEGQGYDAIILGYGLCGNGTVGLTARSIPLVIPRAHDCCTLFMGSREKFLEHFKDNFSSEWGAAGYMERETNYLRATETGKLLGLDQEYNELVEKYGEENAQFVWETLHPGLHCEEATYIEVPETAHLGYLDRFNAFAKEQGKNFRILQGDMRLIRALLAGEWNEEEFLTVSPGKEIKAVYDHDRIITCD